MRTGARKTRIPKTSALLRPQKIISNMRFGCFFFDVFGLQCGNRGELADQKERDKVGDTEIQRAIHNTFSKPLRFVFLFFPSRCVIFFFFFVEPGTSCILPFLLYVFCVFEGVVCVLINFVFRLNDGKIKKKKLGGACWWGNFKRTFRSARLQRRLREFPGGPGCWTDCYCCCGNGCRRRQLWRVGRAKQLPQWDSLTTNRTTTELGPVERRAVAVETSGAIKAGGDGRSRLSYCSRPDPSTFGENESRP